MRLLFNIIILFNTFYDTFAFTSSLPNNTVKLRNGLHSCSLNSCNMNLDRREVFELPFKAALGFLTFTNPITKPAYAAYAESDDLWTKHNGVFTENEIKDYAKTESGLLYKDVHVGRGNTPKDGDVVTINMVGYVFETGDKWCNTYKGIPSYQSSVRAGVRENQQFMKGLNEGVKDIKKGGKRILVIPAYLAYSYTTIFSDKNPEVPLIPGGSSLVCYVEVVNFKKLN